MGVTWECVWDSLFLRNGRKKGEQKIEQTKIEQICMQVKTEMKRKVGKDPGEESNKRKEVWNESPLASMFQKQQTANELNKARETYNQYLRRKNSLGIPNPEDDKFDEYGVSEMKELWKEWGEDVEGSGQVHPAILNNDLGVGALLLE